MFMTNTGIITVRHDLKFNGVYIGLSIKEFNDLGFELGDSLDIYFSNGVIINNVPYYDGYYPSENNFVLCAYSSYPSPCLAFEGSGAWQKCNLKDDDTTEIKLNEKQKFKFIQDTFKQSHPADRSYYVSDEAFSNFRVLKAKNLKENFIYRGGSPICNDFGFLTTVNKLLEEKHINCILNLSDTKDELERMISSCKDYYVYKIYKQNRILPLDLSAFPNELSYAQKIVKGLKEVIQMDGPIYLHCMEGKDRTGFLCILFLALGGGTINEFEEDYMKTYDNFYFINDKDTPEKYKLLRDHYFIDRLMNQLCLTNNLKDFSNIDFYQKAIEYLKFGGMKENEIEELIRFICK